MNREILFRGFHPCDGPDTAAGCFHMKNALMFSELSYGVDMYEVIGTVFDEVTP